MRETDSLGVSVRYFYNERGSILATVNESTGDGIAYTYNEFGRLTGVSPASYVSTDSSYSVLTNSANVEYTYNYADLISTITTESTTYTFLYNEFEAAESVKIGDTEISSYEYNDHNGKLKKITYANGLVTEYEYNELEQLSQIRHNGTVKYRYEYTKDGQIYKLVDLANGKTTVYTYDLNYEISGVTVYDTATLEKMISSEYTYDYYGYLTDVSHAYSYPLTDGEAVAYTSYSYEYNSDGKLGGGSVSMHGFSVDTAYTYDALDKVTRVVYNGSAGGVTFVNTVDYTYISSSMGESGLIGTYTSTVNSNATSYTYTYDSSGNIIKVVSGAWEKRYCYDDLGQLIREDNGETNRTYTYTYDNAGNITCKRTYALTAEGITPVTPLDTVNYVYGNDARGDQLTSYDGHAITYDALGNPLTYYNGASYTFTWSGRRMTSATKGGLTYTFTYNDEGLRTSKTVNGVTTYYYYEGTLLVAEQSELKTIVYLYDSIGAPIGFRYRTPSYAEDVWDDYYYEKNMQGDIVRVYNSEGVSLVSYVYTAWGDRASTTYHHGGANTTVTNNPFTYRGYYYDKDLDLYYLQSRYYDSKVCRFINADHSSLLLATPLALTDKNLYAYCDNNPVVRVDVDGEFWGTAVAIGALGGFVVGVAGQFVSDLVTSLFSGELTFSNWQTYVGAAVGGAVGGAILGGTGNVAAANAASGFITTGLGLTLEKILPEESSDILEKSWIEVGANSIIDGAISYGLGLLPGFNKITQGRNSMSAVYKSGLTKLRNDTVSKMSMKVATKGVASVFVGSLAMDCYYGLKQFGYERIKRLINNYAR